MSDARLDRSAICLVTDRLAKGMLGAYGNTWINTPCFDQLAFESELLTQAVAAAPELKGFYDSVWSGRRRSNTAELVPLPALLRQRGIDTLLISDDPCVLEFSPAAGFDRCTLVTEGDDAPKGPGLASTQLGHFFSTAAAYVAQLEQPALVWLHSRGMAADWDAPLEMRQSYADEEDPTPPDWAEVPHCILSADHDPDELLGIVHAYCGQVTLWDTCLGVLIEALDASGLGDSTLFTLISPRGFPLGEHGIVGRGVADAPRESLYGELIDLCWLIRDPTSRGSALRSGALVQPSDLYETLLDWWEIPVPEQTPDKAHDMADGDSVAARQFVLAHNEAGDAAIRTPAWFMRVGTGQQPADQLFAKPDDLWEVNDIADRCPEVVERLRHVYDAAVRGNYIEPLDEILLSGVD